VGVQSRKVKGGGVEALQGFNNKVYEEGKGGEEPFLLDVRG